MTNEPIKPGYYWAKYKSVPEICCIEIKGTSVSVMGSEEDWGVEDFQIIAPALPPDQWPTYQTLIELVSARMKLTGDFAYMDGFTECYKLFTGKELEAPEREMPKRDEQ